MNVQSKVELLPLALLREPFPDHQISKLPKETRPQIDARKADKNLMVFNCKVCGGHHHKNATHLDYVGHAALTDRLLDADIAWSWEPVAFNADGLPALDRNGGLWIRLTVDGVTRLGYGAADGKQGGDAIKEIIGDALRNAAMRFGAALDLWHKGELHLADEPGGHSQDGAVSPPDNQEAEKPKRVNWGGRYPTKAALHKALIEHQSELRRLANEATLDDLDNYLTSPEYQDFIVQAGEHAPHYLDGPRPDGVPEEFVQTFALEQQARDMIAIRGNQAMEVEPN